MIKLKSWVEGFLHNKKLIQLFSLLFILLICFQNCADSTSSNQIDSSRQYSSLNGNGNGYDGKLTMNAPRLMTPGQTSVIQAMGGTPPYRLISSSPSVEVVSAPGNRFQVKLSENSSVKAFTLELIDSEGVTVQAEVKVWGINRWFFRNPRDIEADKEGRLYVVEQNRPAVTVLDPKGEILYRLDRESVPKVKFNGIDRVAISPDEHLYLSKNNGEIHIFDLRYRTHLRTLKVEEGLPWNECGGITDLESLDRQFFLVSCTSKIFKVSRDGQSKQLLFDHSITRAPIGAFVLSSKGYLVVARNQGVIQKVSLAGELIHQVQLKHGDFIYGRLEVKDLIETSSNEYILSNRGSHRKFNTKIDIENGVFLASVLEDEKLRRKYQYSDGLARLPGGRFAVTENNKSHIFIYNEADLSLSEKWGMSSSKKGAFGHPRDVVVFDGKYYILDAGNNRIVVYDRNGAFLSEIQGFPDKERGFFKSETMDIDSEGNIFVLNYNSGRVLKVSRSGEISSFESEKDLMTSVKRRNEGIALSENHLYITNVGGRYLQKWSQQGSLLQQVDVPAVCRAPRDISYWGGNLYVLCSQGKKSVVVKFDTDFNFLSVFESLPETMMFMSEASRLSIDKKRNRIYISDTGNSRIVVYNSEGRYLYTIGGPGEAVTRFQSPKGVAIDDDGYVIVTDTQNSRIQIFPPGFYQ